MAIPTHDRAGDVATACEAACRDGALTLIVVDASTNNETERVLDRLREIRPHIALHYVRAREPGTAKQRNQAAEVCQTLGIDVVHYIDDDTEVLPGYFRVIEARFASEPELAGVGGVIEYHPGERAKKLKRIFFLWGPHEGSVLRSGRAMTGQYPGMSRNGFAPDYLYGCSMSYRTEMVLNYRFDDRLEGYSFNEDVDLGFRISRHHRLIVDPSARCIHHGAPNGLKFEKFVYLRLVLTYCWVREHRSEGMSLLAFWWSVLGDLLLHLRDRQEAKGIIRGILTTAMGRARRSVVP